MESNNKKFLLIIFILLSSVPLFCQSTREKIKEIKGKAEKVIIKTDKGTYEFSGEDAQNILKQVRVKEHFNFVFNSPDFEDIDIDIPSPPDIPHFFPFGKDIDVDVKDGELTVKITSVEDGKETTKTLTGKEAKEYLENEAKAFDFQWNYGMDSLRVKMKKLKVDCKKLNKHLKKIIIEKDSCNEE